ncbi:MAG TPA: GGDEF domain-containing protein [Polyangiaceae bacterium]|nr:GGDEF domain-containing protein [Polyangiaceae bacterium]
MQRDPTARRGSRRKLLGKDAPVRLGRFLDRLNAFSERQAVAAGVVLLVTVGALDVATGYQLAFSVFYLVPIVIVGWTGGQRAGLFLAVSAGAVWLGADLLGAPRYSHSLLPYWNAAVRTTVFGFVVLLLTSFRSERLLGRTDPLTGLGNRKALFESAASEIARCRRYGHPVSLLYLDCDDFKRINDSRGHSAGDDFLRATARSLREGIRSSDVAARLGGDEFAVLLPEANPDAARAAADKVRGRLAAIASSGDWGVTFSVGCVSFLSPPRSVDELVSSGDDLMYEAKRSGKNTVRSAVHS